MVLTLNNSKEVKISHHFSINTSQFMVKNVASFLFSQFRWRALFCSAIHMISLFKSNCLSLTFTGMFTVEKKKKKVVTKFGLGHAVAHQIINVSVALNFWPPFAVGPSHIHTKVSFQLTIFSSSFSFSFFGFVMVECGCLSLKGISVRFLFLLFS